MALVLLYQQAEKGLHHVTMYVQSPLSELDFADGVWCWYIRPYTASHFIVPFQQMWQ